MEYGLLWHAISYKGRLCHRLSMDLDSHQYYQVLARKPDRCHFTDSLYRLGEYCYILELLNLEIEFMKELECFLPVEDDVEGIDFTGC